MTGKISSAKKTVW